MLLIETPRLGFRHFTLSDAPAVLEFSSDPLVTKYTGDAGNVQTLDDAKNVITQVWFSDYEKYGYGRYAIVHKKDNKVIGFCGLKFLEEKQLPDLGYRLLPQYWGQGLGMEAAKACLEYGFETLKLPKVIAMAMPDNSGSLSILANLGFTNLGTDLYQGHQVVNFEITKRLHSA
ncbi:GNAT family N-acetyltransferase [Psychrosphaera sp. B3R10]|uniref:GNAT family N-acetyltransferase n=1 Tax=Psychrosphaera algicola TaxID=3023714 RepID=A0ABT5F9R3_9GAMM|nr:MULTISPECIES: GNAT family N-acetyltransferase [unclassified Psychrosphaera]MBU2884038.1 GNAT family N-acetyltransferase [Psychrosphaera sp. I2R16]MBU2988168.1 GNAT family N-acetyltransferase [Psychrosphaera sp. B3R10]MDC2888269.1 GNAT family N-acetyltransferase [Psychrosphaera sp. G1-22]